MRKNIIVMDADPEEPQGLCLLLERNHYEAAHLLKLPDLIDHIRQNPCHALILDLDSLPVDNRFIRNLSRENPGLCIIGISSRTFHPELEEAMRAHISACLSKPVDEDELLFWLKSLSDGDPKPRAAPSPELHKNPERSVNDS
jgi:DNA-binding NtrC family response regulator